MASNQDRMAVDEPQSRDAGTSGLKRTFRSIVSPNEKNLLWGSPAKKANIKDEMPDKRLVFLAIVHVHVILFIKFGFTKEDFYNLDVWDSLTGIVYTLHAIFRQACNTSHGSRLQDKVQESFNLYGKTLSANQAALITKNIFQLYDFRYETGAKWVSSFTPILTFFRAFKLRQNEVRLGMRTNMQSDGNKSKSIDFRSYGLKVTHQCFMEGFTYPPAIKSSIAQSLGPMTIAAQLFARDNDVFRIKWENAFKRVFKLIPSAEEVGRILSTGGQNARVIMDILGDLCMFGISRQMSRAHFSVGMVVAYLAKGKQNFLDIFGETRLDEVTADKLQGLDFSGWGMWRFYNSLRDIEFKVMGVVDARLMSEIIVHSVFGTHKEDLSMLEFMTGSTFHKRNEMGDIFKRKGQQGGETTIKLIPFKYVAKLSQAAQITDYRPEVSQLVRCPVFSAKCYQEVTEDFRTIFQDVVARKSHLIYESNPTQLIITKLSLIRDELVKKSLETGRIDFGHTDFIDYADIDKEEKKAIPFVANGPQKYFFNN